MPKSGVKFPEISLSKITDPKLISYLELDWIKLIPRYNGEYVFPPTQVWWSLDTCLCRGDFFLTHLWNLNKPKALLYLFKSHLWVAPWSSKLHLTSMVPPPALLHICQQRCVTFKTKILSYLYLVWTLKSILHCHMYHVMSSFLYFQLEVLMSDPVISHFHPRENLIQIYQVFLRIFSGLAL